MDETEKLLIFDENDDFLSDCFISVKSYFQLKLPWSDNLLFSHQVISAKLQRTVCPVQLKSGLWLEFQVLYCFPFFAFNFRRQCFCTLAFNKLAFLSSCSTESILQGKFH